MSDYDKLVPGDDSANPEPNPEPQPETKPMGKKPIYKSKTFWVNTLTAIAGVLTAAGGSEFIQAHPQIVGIGASVLGVVNVGLRLISKVPVSLWPE